MDSRYCGIGYFEFTLVAAIRAAIQQYLFVPVYRYRNINNLPEAADRETGEGYFELQMKQTIDSLMMSDSILFQCFWVHELK